MCFRRDAERTKHSAKIADWLRGEIQKIRDAPEAFRAAVEAAEMTAFKDSGLRRMKVRKGNAAATSILDCAADALWPIINFNRANFPAGSAVPKPKRVPRPTAAEYTGALGSAGHDTDLPAA